MIYSAIGARHLAALRIVVLLFWLFEVGRSDLAELAMFPSDWFAPHGPWLVVPSRLTALLFAGRGLLLLKWAAWCSVLGVLLGLPGAKLWRATMLALLLLFSSFLRGFGHSDHGHVQIYLVTCVLVFSPAWDVWSLRTKALVEERAAGTTARYPAAFAAMALVFSVPYLATGVYRLAKEGVAFYFGPSMMHFLARDSLVLDDFHFSFELGLWLVEHPALLPWVNLSFAGVTLAEIAAPWAHRSRVACWLFLAIMLPFHALTPLMMHVIFLPNLLLLVALYLVPLLVQRSPSAATPEPAHPRSQAVISPSS